MSRPFTSKNNKDDNKGRSRKPDTDKSKFKPKFSKPSESSKGYSKPERRGAEDRPKRPFTKREDSNTGEYEKRPYTKRDEGDRGGSTERRSFSKPDRGGYEDRPKRPYTKREDSNMGGYEKRPYTKRDESDSKSKDWVPKGKRIILKEEPIKLKSRKSAGDESDFYPDNVDVSIRLNRFLSNAGIASRREADVMITAGLVKVNGKIITELGTKVNPQKDEISYGDARVKVEKKVYVLINKPKNVITTTDDPEGRNTIMELVKDATKERIFPVGRLDRNTTGVLLLTNDGDLSNKLTHPKFGIKKVYIAQLDQNFKLADKQKLLEGVELEDGPIHADALEFKSTDDKKTLFVEIHSGRNRIVHRMFESLGYKVDKLDRTYFAGLTKTSLKRGQWRLLSEQEVNILRRQ